jgi:hypothetical protein
MLREYQIRISTKNGSKIAELSMAEIEAFNDEFYQCVGEIVERYPELGYAHELRAVDGNGSFEYGHLFFEGEKEITYEELEDYVESMRENMEAAAMRIVTSMAVPVYDYIPVAS